jgi:hypothetical protein
MNTAHIDSALAVPNASEPPVHPTSAGQRRPAGERDRARQLEAAVGDGERAGRHQRRHEGGRGHAVGDGAAGADEAEHREHRHAQPVEPHECEDRQE